MALTHGSCRPAGGGWVGYKALRILSVSFRSADSGSAERAIECSPAIPARPSCLVLPSKMRFVLYNIRYATGTGPAFHLPLPGAGYLRSNSRVLERLTQYLKSLDPDLVGLIEVDTGSIRTGLVNQATQIADALGHYSMYQCKYGAA